MSFVPRTTFHALDSLPRSFFLGHHKAGLSRMKSLLGSIDLIIECRDYRLPLTSRNPLFEKSLGEKERWIVYTKTDLGPEGLDATVTKDVLTQFHAPSRTIFLSNKDKTSSWNVLEALRAHASTRWSLTGHRALVVGMPNVGKSTLINSVRYRGVRGAKAATTGAQPGITRKIGSGVKIIEAPSKLRALDAEGETKTTEDAVGGAVYLIDTPGVFIPYVPDATAMLKLALVGCVKDNIVEPAIMADYLLYHMNLHNPGLYAEYHPPTNNVIDLLSAVALKMGRLGKGARVDTDGAALWLVQRWRQGKLGRFLLDEVREGALEAWRVGEVLGGWGVSMSQARKIEKRGRSAKARERREGGGG